MEQKRVVVTGAAGGLGKALCSLLAREGWDVIGTDVRGADHTLDVTSADACRELAQRLQPDAWINNAGVLGAGSAVDQSDFEIERVIQVNLMGVIHGSRAAARVMRQRGRGHIINVGSLASWFAPMGQAVYAASKHGMRAFSISLSAELAGTGVHVSVLCPDGVRTPMLSGRENDPHAAMSFTGGHLLEADEVARAALSLLEKPRLMAFVPKVKGIGARVVGALPSANVAATRVLAMYGRHVQARIRKSIVPAAAE